MEEPRSRRSLLAAAGAATLLAGCGAGEASPARDGQARAVRAPGDRDVVAFALTLEYFEADLYERLVDEQILSGRDQDMARRFADEEAAHVQALEKTLRDLGGRMPQRPRPDYARLLAGGPRAVLGRLADIEDLGAAAYLGQASKIQDRDILAAALSIHAIEARHAAALNYRVGRSFVPDGALASPIERRDVLDRVEALLA